jgi:hypothetical protein
MADQSFLGFPHVAVERFEVEVQLARTFGTKLPDLQLERHQAGQASVKEN